LRKEKILPNQIIPAPASAGAFVPGADGSAVTGRRVFMAVILTPGSAAADLKVFDNDDGSGVARLHVTAQANGQSVPLYFEGIEFGHAAWYVLTGTGATAHFEEGV
jgi:hypothetical protein